MNKHSDDDHVEGGERFKQIQNAYESIVKNQHVFHCIIAHNNNILKQEKQQGGGMSSSSREDEEFEKEKEQWFNQEMQKERQFTNREFEFDEPLDGKDYLIYSMKWVFSTLALKLIYDSVFYPAHKSS